MYGRYTRRVDARPTCAIALVVSAAIAVGCADSTGSIVDAESDVVEESVDPGPGPDRLDTLFDHYPDGIFDALVPDTTGAAKWVEETLEGLDHRGRAAQLIIADFGAPTEVGAVPRGVLRAVRESKVGGVLVPRLMPPTELRTALVSLQKQADVPLIVAADYERGAGRFNNMLTELPSSMAIGATADTVFAAAAGRLIALESRAIGVNLLLAPVVDVNRNAANPIINIRSFGDDAAAVGRFAASFTAEAERLGLLTTYKHFPGHGNTSVDSHAELAMVAGSTADIASNDVHPYAYAIATQRAPAAVMTGHLWAPALDDEPGPATFSARVIDSYLRRDVGFRGIVITDDVRMGAIRREFNLDQRVVRSVAAGNDMVLTPEDVDRAVDAIVAAVEDGRLPRAAVDNAARRVLQAKAHAGLHKPRPRSDGELFDVVTERPLGQRVSDAIARASITRVGGDAPGAVRTPAVIHLANYEGSESIVAAMDSVDAGLAATQSIRRATEMSNRDRLEVLRSVEAEATVVVVLYQRLVAGRGEAGLLPGHRALVQALLRSGRPIVVISLGNPYESLSVADGGPALIGYDQSIATVHAAVAVLRGEAAATGVLPVAASR